MAYLIKALLREMLGKMLEEMWELDRKKINGRCGEMVRDRETRVRP
jgi:hypothetical protein